MNTLLERHTGGSLNFNGGVGVKVKAGGWAHEVKVEVEDRPRIEDTLSYTKALGGLEVTGKLKSNEAGTTATIEGKASGKIGGHKVGLARTGNSGRVSIGIAEVELQGSKLGMSLQPVPSTFDGSRTVSAGIELKSKVTVDGATARLEVRQILAAQAKLGSVGLELSGAVGFGYQGMSREAVINAVAEDGVGIFTEPDELRAGTQWEQLPGARRTQYERVGWSAAEWRDRLAGAARP